MSDAAARPTAAVRWLRAAAAIGLALLLAAGAITAWLARSDGGSAWLLSHVPGLTVTAPKGRLLDGPFAAERVEYRLGPRVLTVQGLAWQDASWSWRPHDGAWFALALTAPHAARVELVLGSEASPLKPPSSLRLPFVLSLRGASIDVLQVDAQAPITQIGGDLVLGAVNGTEHRLDALAFDRDRAHMQARGRIASDAPFALELQADAHSRDGAPAWQGSASARGPLAQMAVKVQLGSDKAPGAKLRIDAGVLLFAAWPLATLSAAMAELDLAALDSALPATRLSGDATFDTRGLDAPIAARVALRNALAGRWDQQRLPIAALDVDLAGHAGERSQLEIQRFALQLIEGAGRVEGSGAWRAGKAQLALRLQAVRPALLDARAAPMTLSGSATLEADGLPSPDGATALAARQTLQGQLTLDGRLDARSTLPVQVGARLDAHRNADAWYIELRDLLMRSADARSTGTLVAEGKAGAWQLKGRGELAGFDPTLWLPGASDSAWRKGPHRLAGHWQAELQGDATLAKAHSAEARLLALRGNAQLDLQESLLAGTPLQGSVKLDGHSPGWAVDAELRSGNNRATLQGRLAPRADDDRWRMSLDAPALAALQPLLSLQPTLAAALRNAGRPLAGQLAGQAQVQGRWPAIAVDGELRANALQAFGLAANKLQLKAQAGPVASAPLHLQLDGEQVAIDDVRADLLQLRIDGNLTEHRLTLDAQSPLRPPAWADTLLGGRASGTRLTASARGQWQPNEPRKGLLPGRWRGQAIDAEARDRAAGASAPWLRAHDLALQLQVDANGQLQAASVDAGRIEALGGAVRWSDARWQAGPSRAQDEANLDLQLEPLAIAAWLQKLRPGAGIGGNLVLGGHARVHLGRQVSADVVLERASGDLTLTDETGSTAFGLTDLRMAVAAQDGTWHFTQALAGSNLGVLAGAQSVRLAADARWPARDTPMQGVLEWQVADLAAWAPFTPPGWRLAGALRTGAALGGSFGAPEITGEVTGNRLAVRNLLLGVDLRDGDMALSLRGGQARIERLVFKGGSGELRLTGGARLGAEPDARLQFEASRFQVLGRFDRRVVASGSATLSLTPQALNLDGRFRIDEGLIDFSRSDAPALDSDVQVRGGRHAAPAAEPEATETAPNASGTAPRSTRVALQVDLGDELKLRGRGLDTRLRGNLALSTPGGRLAVNGSVRTESGTYAAYGQKLSIERGVVSFGGPIENPRLDIVAVRPNLDLRVGVQVSGSAQTPRVRLFSEPEMSDTDKLSWLVLGRAPEGLARTDTALLQRAALALLAGEGEGLDRTLLANLGLDEFSVRQTETGEVRDTVVTLGKQLSRRWYVGYERGVNSTTGTWQLIYRAAQRITVRAQAGEDNALDAIWTWRWN